MSRVFISQSNYIPWKGFFDTIAYCDIYVLYDDMQYTKRDWRNRNKIKTDQGLKWLSIPVEVSGKYHQKIRDTRISDSKWNEKHWNLLKHNYSKSKFFKELLSWLEPLYLTCNYQYLSEINYHFIISINKYLGINTKLIFSSEFNLHEERSERLAVICEELNAKEYVAGPSSKNYMDHEPFNQRNISIEYMDYSGYPEYDQFHPPFDHSVTILDLLFHKGPNAYQFMKFI